MLQNHFVLRSEHVLYNDEKPPFDPSLMVYFRKRLTPEILGEINEMIIRNSESKENSDDEDKSNPPSNKGTMIVDAAFIYQKKFKNN